jgi:hypothetical protein
MAMQQKSPSSVSSVTPPAAGNFTAVTLGHSLNITHILHWSVVGGRVLGNTGTGQQVKFSIC